MFRNLGVMVGLVSVVVLVAGCSGGGTSGQKLIPVKGKVTFKGAPLAGARVNFVSAYGEVATGVTDAQGAFTLTTRGQAGAAPGEYKVAIVKSSVDGGGPTSGPKPEDMFKMAAKKGEISLSSKSEIPEKYADAQKSGLSATVSTDGSNNEFTFDLTE